eukprot:9462007-Prorocentrum_lima.AAC.1
MTSSLVGSEMCIRDRLLGAQGGCDSCVPSGSYRRGQCAGPCPHHTATAVSYTHLTLPTICSV